MSYYNSNRRDYPGDYFPLPKAIFHLGLNANEIAVLAFLMYCENRKTYTCHPSYSTIGKACQMSVNTVRIYVESLQRKGFIHAESTKVTTRNGKTHNGSLLYTILPIQPLIEDYYQEQLRQAEYTSAYTKAMKKYEKKYGEKNNETISI